MIRVERNTLNGTRSFQVNTSAANQTDALYEKVAERVFGQCFAQSIVRIDDTLPLNDYTIIRCTPYAPALLWRGCLYAGAPHVTPAPHASGAWRWRQFFRCTEPATDTDVGPADVGVYVFNNRRPTFATSSTCCRGCASSTRS